MHQQKRIFCLGLIALVVWMIHVSSAGASPQQTANEKAAEDHVKRGTALFGKRNLDGAIAEYREAIRLDPNYTEAHDNLGVALGYKGDVDGGIAEIREAIRISPNYAEAHSDLGAALMQKGRSGGSNCGIAGGHPPQA
jgi:Flp pilus assembly protein TadD